MNRRNQPMVLHTLLWCAFALLVVLCAAALPLQAQNPAMQASNWFFGKNMSLPFSWNGADILSGSLSNSISPMQAPWGCSSISTQEGILLFYTDGQTVWGSNHQPLSGGTGLQGNSAAKRSSIIVPKPSAIPGAPKEYYIFYTTGDYRLKYAIVVNNGGAWEVIVKNQNQFGGSGTVARDVGQTLTVCRHRNNRDFWLIAHSRDAEHFYVFQIQPIALPTLIPSSVQGFGGIYYFESSIRTVFLDRLYIKLSPNGRYLGVSVQGEYNDVYSNWLLCYDFDNATGKISSVFRKNRIVFIRNWRQSLGGNPPDGNPPFWEDIWNTPIGGRATQYPGVPSAVEFSCDSKYLSVAYTYEHSSAPIKRSAINEYSISQVDGKAALVAVGTAIVPMPEAFLSAVYVGDLQLARNGDMYLTSRSTTPNSSTMKLFRLPSYDVQPQMIYGETTPTQFFSLPNFVTSYLDCQSNTYVPPCDECVNNGTPVPWSAVYTASVPPPNDYPMGGNIIVEYQTRMCNNVKELRIIGLKTNLTAFPSAAYSPDRLFQYLEDRWLRNAYSNSTIPLSTNADDRTIVRFHFWRCWSATLCGGLTHWWPCSDEFCCYREYEVGVDCNNNVARYNMRSYTNAQNGGGGFLDADVAVERADRDWRCSPTLVPPPVVEGCSGSVSILNCLMLQCERLDPTVIQ